MRLKSYFADSVQAAMEKARVELGPEAMLISSRQSGLELKDLGRYEVVFGLEPADAPVAGVPAPAKTGTSAGADETVLRELAEMRRQLECLGQSVARSGLQRTTETFTPELARHFDRLLHAGLSPEFAQEVIEAAMRRTRPISEGMNRFARDLFQAILREEIESRFSVAPALGDGEQPSTAVLFVGPPGAGKTSSLVKLGLEYGVKARRPLRFLTLDTLRIGGSDQLARYARISGAEFRALPDASVLSAALGRSAVNELALIDTPGYGVAESADAAEVAAAVRDLPVEVQLVLPATFSPAAAHQAAARFAVFQPSKLLLTHMDEGDNHASAIQLSARLELPLSFFGTGQQIPEDIVAAQKAALLQSFAPLADPAANAAAA